MPTLLGVFLLLGRGLVSIACVVVGEPGLELWPEVPDEPLDGPGSAVGEGADGVALDLLGQLPEEVDLLDLGVALD